MKSASKLPPLPRKFSPTVYETFLEQSDAAAGGKVLEGRHRLALAPSPTTPHVPLCSQASTSPTADGNKSLKSPPLPPPKSKRLSQL